MSVGKRKKRGDRTLQSVGRNLQCKMGLTLIGCFQFWDVSPKPIQVSLEKGEGTGVRTRLPLWIYGPDVQEGLTPR